MEFGFDLQRFADGAGAAAGAPGAEATGQAAVAGQQPGEAQAQAQAPAEQQDVAAKPAAGQDKGKAWQELVNGEFKEQSDRWFQERFDKRFKDHKALQSQTEAVKPVLELLGKKYGWDGKDPAKLAQAILDDDSYYEQQALERGMTVKDYKEWVKLERENSRLTQALQAQQQQQSEQQRLEMYRGQAEALFSAYPDADTGAEFENPDFRRMVEAGIDLKTAYEIAHKDDILSGAMKKAAQAATKRVADSVAANLARPQEAGGAGTGAGSMAVDVSKLTRKELEEYARRARGGERITFTS